MDRLILHNLPPMHWAVAGIGIAGIVLALLLLASRRLAVSSGFEDICSLVLQAPYFRRPTVVSGRSWRLPLLAGLVIGGFLSAVLGGGCTAGHGIFGLANLERPSAISTLSFVIAGIVTTQIVYRLLFPLAGL